MISSQPLVSVVIPTFNRPRQLAECLQALQLQTLAEPWEVIVVDDGSIIPAAQIETRQLLSQVCTLKIIRQANGGPASARNYGVSVAHGELVAFTDDDCRPAATWLEQLVFSWRNHQQALIGGSTINDLKSDIYAGTSQLIVDLVYEFYNRNPRESRFFASNNFLCSKIQFLSLSGFDITFPRAGAEDRDFCDRWRHQNFPLVWCSSACVYHYHRQSLTSFVELHFRYGRGAYLYQRRKKQRHSGTFEDELNFHASLPKLLRSRWDDFGGLRLKIFTLLLLATWQVANLAGFAYQALEDRRFEHRAN